MKEINKRLRFGFKTAPQRTSYQNIRQLWLEADTLPPFEHAWLFDHFMPMGQNLTDPCPESWTLLSALAAQTKRLRLGVMVTANTYRHPALLAKMAATVDNISQGRLDVGIGAGSYILEHEAYGFSLYTPRDRVLRLGEACEIMLRMWTEKGVHFNGSYYQLKQAYCEPSPLQKPHPPLLIGGSGEQFTLPIVAHYANIWNFAGGSIEEFVHKNAMLDNYCIARGRDPVTIERSVQVLVNPTHMDKTRTLTQKFIEAGATHLVLDIRAPYPEHILPHLVDKVIKPIQAKYN